MPKGIGYGKKASKKLGIPMKELVSMKKKTSGKNMKSLIKYKGYKGESD